MKLGALLALLGLAVACVHCTLPQLMNVNTKFEYKNSFKGPHMLDSKGNIPFWTIGGSAIASDDYLRVCPSVRSHKGWAWSKNTLTSNNWFIDVSLRVTGRLKTGADGMAIWVTAEKGGEGPVYGSSDRWRGVGLFLDSFDNDAQGDNPKIQLVINDGTISYDHRSDGNQQQSSSCLKDFRNRPQPVKIRMTFIRGVLEVWVHEGLSVVEDDYELCMKVEGDGRLKNVPNEMYFGVSAATGGLSDDHDVSSFMVYAVETFEEKATRQIMENDTRFMETQERYKQMSGEFDQRRENYLKENPEVARRVRQRTGRQEGDMDWQTRMDLEQSVQVVGDMMAAVQREIKGLTRKMDSMMAASREDGGRGGGVPSSLSNELSQIRNTESSILSQLADLKSSMGHVGDSPDLQPLVEVKNLVRQQSSQLESFTAHLQELSQKQCPAPADMESSSCLSPWLFIVVALLQVGLFIGYSLYTQAQEMKAKKFF